MGQIRSIIIILLLVLLMVEVVTGQDRRHAVSGRIGLSSGIAYQLMVDEFRGYRGFISFRDGGIQLTGMIESYRPIYLNFTDKIYYYTGMGAHIGFTRWQSGNWLWSDPFRYYRQVTWNHVLPVIGLDAIMGIEYRIERIPLTFSLDVKPFFELFGQNIFRLSLFDIGLSVKIHF